MTGQLGWGKELEHTDKTLCSIIILYFYISFFSCSYIYQYSKYLTIVMGTLLVYVHAFQGQTAKTDSPFAFKVFIM